MIDHFAYLHCHHEYDEPADSGREGSMGIGISVFLLAVGAILAFAVQAKISGLDIAVVGYVLMAAGLLGLLLTLFLWGPRRRGPRTEIVERTVVRDSDIY